MFRETLTESYLTTRGSTLHLLSQHLELPPQSAPGLMFDRVFVLIQLLDEVFVNPIIASKIPSLTPRKLASEKQTGTKLTGMGSASGRNSNSKAQFQAAIIIRSAVAFAMLNRDSYFRSPTHPEEVNSLILQTRDVPCSTKFAGSKLFDGTFSCRHWLSFGP